MHVRLEAYLEELERPLEGLSVEARREWREEARQHLVALVEAHEELGRPPEEAVEAAIASFGDPVHLGREMRKELTPGLVRSFVAGLAGALQPWNTQAHTPWEGLGRAFGLFTLPVCLVLAAVIIPFLHLVINADPPAVHALLCAGGTGYWVAPLLAGAWLGLWSGPQRTVRCANLPGLLLGLVSAWPFANFLRHAATGFAYPGAGWEYLLFWFAHGAAAYLLTRRAMRKLEGKAGRKPVPSA